jgi:SCP-2 sterol transfer family protein
VILRGRAGQAAQPGDGGIHASVASWRWASQRSFGIMVLIFLPGVLVQFFVHVRYPPAGTLPSDADKSEAHMATAEECREALQTLTGRLSEMSPQDRSSFFSNRTFSCYVTDLGITFMTRITENGAEPVKEVGPDEPPADIRLTANSDDTVALAATPANIARMWMSGRVKIQASLRDLLALRRLL